MDVHNSSSFMAYALRPWDGFFSSSAGPTTYHCFISYFWQATCGALEKNRLHPHNDTNPNMHLDKGTVVPP